MKTVLLVLLVVLVATIFSARTVILFQNTLAFQSSALVASDERGDESSNWRELPQETTSIYDLENVSIPSSAIADDDVNRSPSSPLKGVNHELISIESSPLNDKTLTWDSSVDRVWMTNNNHQHNVEQQRPAPAVLTLTNLYWNHRNQPYRGLKNFRTKRTRELIEGVINHPWFDPTVWEELVSSGDNSSRWKNDTSSTRIYVFFDYDTCKETNYPQYGSNLDFNADTLGGRTSDASSLDPQEAYKKLVKMKILRSSNMHRRLKVVIFDCGGQVPYCLTRNNNPHEFVSLVSLSASPSNHFPQDLGLPPPLLNKKTAEEEEHHIRMVVNKNNNNEEECRSEHRPYLLFFCGNFRHQVRQDLKHTFDAEELNKKTNDVLILHAKNQQPPNGSTTTYEQLLLQSQFGAAPRGDNRFSYRFTEVMSAGAIPVVYANDWVWPLDNIIPWKRIAVSIPEEKVNQTRRILEEQQADICQRRREMMYYYRKYIETPRGTIVGIIESLEKKFRDGQWFTNAPPGKKFRDGNWISQ